MSSILEALKKAEQESTMERSAGTPWPARLPMQSPNREGRRRWWVPLGIVLGLCVAGMVLWQVRQPEMAGPADSSSALPSQPLATPNQTVLPPVAKTPKTRLTIAEQPQAPPGKTLVDASPRQATDNAPAPEVRASDTMAVATPVQPEKQPLRAAAPTSAAPTSKPVAAPAEDPAPRPAEAAATSQPAAARETEKRFRSDPRIDLQALVWAPESAGRFVVINNRLIKEGGFVDNIVVVSINMDDVLLAEGSDRWHEAFNIR